MIAATLLFVLQSNDLPTVGDVRVLERTCRWINREEEIDFAQVEQFRVKVSEVFPQSITVEVQRQLVMTILEGEKVPADRVEMPDTWTQKFHPRAPATLAWAGTRDKVEARLDQITLLRLPQDSGFQIPNVTKHEIGPLQAEATKTLKFESGTFQATGTWSGERPWVNTKITAKNQFLPGSSFRGQLTVETKWLPKPTNATGASAKR